MIPQNSLPQFPMLSALVALLLATPMAAQTPGYYTPDPLSVFTREDTPAFQSQAAPVRLVAPIHGVASAPVLISGDRRNLRLPFLVNETGHRIPENAIMIRYAQDRIPEHEWSHPVFDALLSEPDPSLPFQPVWVSVQVPPNTPPGEYRGFLAGGRARVPVELRVADFVLPSSRDWVSFAYLVQSPEAVAWTYEHELWSPEHLQKLRASLHLMAGLGNNVAHLTVLRDTHFGNDHGTVVFRREGNRVVPDFRFVDRFLDLYQEQVGEPRVLWLYLWEPGKMDGAEVEVSFIGPDGSLTAGSLARYGDEGAGEPWRLLVEGLRERVRQRGWDPASVMVGAGHDYRPTPEMQAFFNAFDPPVQWVVFSHWRGDNTRARPLVISGDMDVGFAESPSDPRNNRLINRTTLGGGWTEEHRDDTVVWSSSFRGTVMRDSEPVQYRWMPDAVVQRQHLGFTRMGLDGWRAVNPGTGNRVNTLTRYRNSWYNLWRNNPLSITAPGPDGAVATVRYEMLREGIQEVEARIVLEKALATDELPEDPAGAIREFLKARNGVRYDATGRSLNAGENWQDTTLRLFELAGQAGKALGWTVNVDPAPREPGSEFRVWTSQDGRTIRARFLGVREGLIALKREDGQRFTAPVTLFSEADQNWVREQ